MIPSITLCAFWSSAVRAHLFIYAKGSFMPNDHAYQHIDTWEMQDLIEEILLRIPRPYPPDITDQVFLSIERTPDYLRRYELYAGENIGATNAWIGKMVKEITALEVRGKCTEPKSSLIKSYSILGY